MIITQGAKNTKPSNLNNCIGEAQAGKTPVKGHHIAYQYVCFVHRPYICIAIKNKDE